MGLSTGNERQLATARASVGARRSAWRSVLPFLAGIAAAGALFTGMVVASVAAGREVIATQRRVTHTLEVLRVAEALDSAISRAESFQRAFLLARNESFRRDSAEQSEIALAASERLADMTADNADQHRRVEQLRDLLKLRLTRLESVVAAAREADHATIANMIASEAALRLPEQLRAELDAVIDAENALLEARHARQREALGRARVAYVGAAVTGFLVFGVFAVLLRAHLTVQGEVTTALAASEAQFRKIADGLPQLIYLTDETGQVRLTNERWREFTGIEPSAVRRGDEGSFVHPDDLAGTLDAWNRALSTNRPYERELRIRRRDGEYVWHLSRAAPLTDSLSGETLWLGSMTDIDERRRQEAKVRESEARVRELHRSLEERAAELTAVNRELEAFSYSVSHDLRAPLRHIDGFATLLEKQLHGTLDEKALRYLKTIREATRDLGRLIDDLLDFSRLGRQSLRTMRVAPGELVREAAEVAERAEPGRRIEWKLGPLPDVEADRTLLRVALDNLLGNAVKYTRPRELATITVDAAESEDGMRTIRVSDNGVGFDMRYASKLFGVFQRLHSEAEFEGTGIGLATVQRVVHRMGGRVRGEGAPGAGATFFLTLPAPHQEEG